MSLRVNFSYAISFLINFGFAPSTTTDLSIITFSSPSSDGISYIEVIKRLPGGVADELLIETTKDTYLVIGEYNIRYVLSDGESEIIRNDGSAVTVSNLLPSAYFIIEPEFASSDSGETITLLGGGYGHGVGMSQNGARQAALQGMTYEEILELFYQGLELKKAN